MSVRLMSGNKSRQVVLRSDQVNLRDMMAGSAPTSEVQVMWVDDSWCEIVHLQRKKDVTWTKKEKQFYLVLGWWGRWRWNSLCRLGLWVIELDWSSMSLFDKSLGLSAWAIWKINHLGKPSEKKMQNLWRSVKGWVGSKLKTWFL